MIVTLAGHVDHGKTSLVKALTGVDTDRLAEEKARGLTIDLGFAYIDDGAIGFVDVPGHQRFIANMVAGVAAQQYGLLVIAADDGLMPQTIEHLEILQLIGVRSGVIALSKCDRADADQIDAVKAAGVWLQCFYDREPNARQIAIENLKCRADWGANSDQAEMQVTRSGAEPVTTHFRGYQLTI